MTAESSHRSVTRRMSPGRIAVAVVALGVVVSLVSSIAGGATNHAKQSLVISTEKTSALGTILVSGTPLYTLKSNGTPCATQCLKYWPAVLLPKGAAKATAGNGVSAAKLGTIKRAGSLQVTYAGKPLYWFYKDKAADQVNGNITDTWGKWSVVVTVKPASSGATTTTTRPGGGGATTTTTSPSGGGVGF